MRPPDTLPSWTKAILAALACTQIGMAVAFLRFMPGGWSTVYGIPVSYASALALGVAGVLVLLTVLAWLRNTEHLVWHGYHLLAGLRSHPVSLVLVLALLLPAFFFLAEEWWGQNLIGLQFALVALLLYLADPGVWTAPPRQRLTVLSICVIMLGLALRLWLLRAEWVWTDEGYYLSATTSTLEGGGLSPIMMRIPGSLPVWGYAYWLYTGWAKLVGLGLLQARIASFLIGLLSLPLLFATVRLWYSTEAAWVSTAIASLSILFLESIIARPDALAMTLTGLALFVHVYAFRGKNRRRWLHTLVGALAVLSLEGHITNLIFLFAFSGYYLIDFLRGMRRERRLFYAAPVYFFGIGAAAVALLYVYAHVLLLPHPERFFTILTSHQRAIEGSFLEGRLALARSRYAAFWRFSAPEALLILAATVAALARRTESDQHWLILMLLAQVGYFLVGPVGDIPYLIPGLTVFLSSAGALITMGFRREGGVDSLTGRLALLGILLLLGPHDARLIARHGRSRESFEREHAALFDYIRENIPPDATIIGPAAYYPYLVEYRSYIHPYFGEVRVGPILANSEVEAYWLDVLLETWPTAWINPPEYEFPQLSVHQTYMAARQAEEKVGDLWVVTDDLVTDPPYAQASNPAALQMVAHGNLPSEVPADSILTLHTIWITRDEIAGDYSVTVSLVDAGDEERALFDRLLVSGWAGTPTSRWSPDQFHNAELSLRLPGTLEPGDYALRITIHPASGHEDIACGRVCEFIIDNVTIVK